MKSLFKFLGGLMLLLGITGCSLAGSNSSEPPLKIYEYDEIKTGEVIDGQYSQFVNINVNTSYLGYGYDVINEPYMSKNSINMSAPILDKELIKKASLMLIKENSSEFKSYKASTMEEFAQKYSASLNIYGKYGKCFSGGLKADYKGSNSEKTFYTFYKSVYQLKTFNLYLTNSVEDIREMLSEPFKRDLETMSPGNLFDKYGTHLIREVAMGGRIEISTTYSSSTTGYTNEAEAAVNAHIKYMTASINAEVGASYSNECQNQGIQEETEIKQFGGILINTSSVEACSANYSKWLQSFDEDLANSALSGIVGENSLIGLWDLLDPNDIARKKELENYFISSADEAYYDLCSLFKLNNKRYVNIATPENGTVTGNCSPYQRGDTVTLLAVPNEGYSFEGWYIGDTKVCSTAEYSFEIDTDVNLSVKFIKGDSMVQLSGSGTEADPYLISTRDHFAQISKDMSAHYKVTQDINFGNASWMPIAGAFNGYIDGDGHRLSNIRISKSAASSIDTDVNLGLFEVIGSGGYIYNLHFKDCQITYGEQHGGKGNISAGILCGVNYGTIDNCTFAVINVSVERAGSNIGAICGASTSRMENCVLVSLHILGCGNVGGMAGYLSSSATVVSCVVGSSIDGNSYIELDATSRGGNAGGIVGLADGCTIRSSQTNYTDFKLTGNGANNPTDSGNPTMGIISGYQLAGKLINIQNTAASITKTKDSTYSSCFFAISWGISGRFDYNPVVS